MVNIHENEVVFFGKITAGITHEMQNVLAIINESSGLMEDLMAMTADTSPCDERYQKALAKIKVQVKRGVGLMTTLNHFAHSPDHPVKQLDLNRTTAQLIELSKRYARLKNVVLKTCPPAPSELPIHMVINSVQLQMALFAGIECWLSLVSPGNEINLYPLEKEGTCIFTFQCEGDFTGKNELAHCLPKVETWPLLQGIVTSLGGHVEIDESTSRFLVVFPNLKTDERSSI